jgi:hypothetical protein
MDVVMSVVVNGHYGHGIENDGNERYGHCDLEKRVGIASMGVWILGSLTARTLMCMSYESWLIGYWIGIGNA